MKMSLVKSALMLKTKNSQVSLTKPFEALFMSISLPGRSSFVSRYGCCVMSNSSHSVGWQ